jgi:hypothetical protein
VESLVDRTHRRSGTLEVGVVPRVRQHRLLVHLHGVALNGITEHFDLLEACWKGVIVI